MEKGGLKEEKKNKVEGGKLREESKRDGYMYISCTPERNSLVDGDG